MYSRMSLDELHALGPVEIAKPKLGPLHGLKHVSQNSRK